MVWQNTLRLWSPCQAMLQAESDFRVVQQLSHSSTAQAKTLPEDENAIFLVSGHGLYVRACYNCI
jgi:hypothetical protein